MSPVAGKGFLKDKTTKLFYNHYFFYLFHFISKCYIYYRFPCNLAFTNQSGAFQLSSIPWEGGDLASCEGPCRASLSSADQSSWAEVEVGPCCQADRGGLPALAQGLAGELTLVKDLGWPGAEGKSDFGMLGCVAAAVVATAAAASEAAPGGGEKRRY